MEAIPGLGLNFLFVIKIMFLLAIVIYMIFATVVVRQVGLMTKTLAVGFEFPIKIVAWLHLVFAIGTLVLALLIL